MKERLPSLFSLIGALSLALVACSGCQSSGGGGPDAGVTPAESFESVIPPLMSKWNIPGGAVALARNESIVLVAAYGLADKTGVEVPA